MNPFYIFMAVLILAGVGAVSLAGWAGKHQKTGMMRKLLWGFWIFLTCANFPLWNERDSLQHSAVLTAVSIYAVFGTGLYGVYRKDRGPFLYPKMLLCTALGLLCRYLLEFGEISNTYNFTLWNIVVYLFAIPVYSLLVYEFCDKRNIKLK